MIVLGIETSCDETAAAVVRDGREILSSIIHSQIEMHTPYGGVVPELASREHLSKIETVIDRTLVEAGCELSDMNAIAVTQGPGLIGALLVGVCYAKSLAFGLDVPIVGVNHIEGHVFSIAFENPEVEYPAVALIVSGGHTNIFHVPEPGKYKIVSRTRDDAAGEAFDKVAKMLGLGYPGGPIIEKIAKRGDPKKIKFTKAKISDGKPDLSFSGLKTAVSKHVKEHGIDPFNEGGEISQDIADLAASFQFSVVGALTSTMERIANELQPKTLIVAGGVACNLALQEKSLEVGARLGVPVYFPSKHLSTDNAAMIAAAGHFHLINGRHSDDKLTADVTLRLQNIDLPPVGERTKRLKYRI